MGSSTAMRIVQILSACLCMVSATSECAGEGSCPVEKDAAALLQSNLQLHDAASASNQVALEDNEEDDKKVSSAHACDANTDREDCGAGCTWTGATCREACSEFNNDRDTCEGSGYCLWPNSGRNGDCKEYYDRLTLGATSPLNKKWWSMTYALRPELATKSKSVDGQTWVPCGGDVDCFHGTNTWQHRYDSMLVDFGSSGTYTKASLDLQIDCEHNSEVVVKFTKNNCQHNCRNNHRRRRREDAKRSNVGDLKLVYNSQEYSSWVSSRRRAKDWQQDIQTSSSDVFPVLRLEATRSTTSGQAYMEVWVQISNAPIWFDKCMETKRNHGQCLVMLNGVALRTDHAEQKRCIDGPQSSDTWTRADIPGCETPVVNGFAGWYGCLDTDTRTMISSVIEAFDGEPGTRPSLVQEQHLTHGWQNRTYQYPDDDVWAGSPWCTSGAHPVCEDPTHVDIEGFDCSCVDRIKNADGTIKPYTEIRAIACQKSQTRVCCGWKDVHCDAPSDYTTTPPPAALLQDNEELSTSLNQEAKLETNTSMEARAKKASENAASLDQSCAGKRTV